MNRGKNVVVGKELWELGVAEHLRWPEMIHWKGKQPVELGNPSSSSLNASTDLRSLNSDLEIEERDSNVRVFSIGFDLRK